MRYFNLGPHDVIRFTGTDAVRFLNGQLTQDVRNVADGNHRAAFSCVTDAKGRLQFRVVIATDDAGSVLVAVPTGQGEALEARLTRYLIADDAEATLIPEAIDIHHIPDKSADPPTGVMARIISRFGEDGTDWWIPSGADALMPDGAQPASIEDMEALRISRGIPGWGTEITEGMLPPEARLESTDISYRKGCYIGQEVISRIKSAGKVNRMLTRFEILSQNATPGAILDVDGKEVGICTSITPPCAESPTRLALGFLRRNAPADGLRLGHSELRIIEPS